MTTVENVAHAAKTGLATDLRRVMKRGKITQTELARRMSTSRAIVHRLLKADDVSLTLTTMSAAAAALGCKIKIKAAA